MYKYTCKCGYIGDYLVPHFKNNTVRCPVCSNKFPDIGVSDIESVRFRCPYCKEENDDRTMREYMSWKTCEHCGRDFEASKRVRYFIK